MNAIKIDFAPAGFSRTLRQMHAWHRLALVAGIALGIWSATHAQAIIERIDAKRAAIDRANASLSARANAKPVARKTNISEAQANAVNGAVAQLNIPWRDVLDAIESSTPKEIALLSLEPDARKNILHGMAEAKSSDDMLAYIEQLKKPGFFDVVALTKHETNDQDPNKPLRFQFEAHWPGEAK